MQYRMTMHLFGAASSPGCSNFEPKKAATDNESKFGSIAANFIRNNFYVDNSPKSAAAVSEATLLMEDTKSICATGKCNMFISNSKDCPLRWSERQQRSQPS